MCVPESPMDLSIVIPAYNEALRLPPTLEALAAFLVAHYRPFEVVVVDDGSTDRTLEVCEAFRQRMPFLRVIDAGPNRGKGHAVRVGMRAARGAVRVMYDADGSTPPSELPALVAPVLRGEAAVSIGSRYAAGAVVEVQQPLYRRLWSRLANRVFQALLLPGIADTHCGFKAFSAAAADDVFSRCEVDGWSFDVEALALASARGFEIREVPVRWADEGQSRARAWHMVRAARDLLRIRWRLRHPREAGA